MDGPCLDDTNRYVNCQNGTVTDTVTGLIWLQQADYLPNAAWAAANQAAAGLKDGDCGLTDGSSPGDWRLPTRDEWSATVARAVAMGCTPSMALGPSLTNDAGTACFYVGPSSFPGTIVEAANFVYWSSTSDETFPTNAKARSLDDGANAVGVKSQAIRVWPVRGGPR